MTLESLREEMLKALLESKATVEVAHEFVIARQFPLFVVLEVLDQLARDNQGVLVEAVLAALDRRKVRHPLLDDFKGKFLWAYKDRQEAIDFLRQAATDWNREYLAELARIFHPWSKN